jgi:hypothetical protein
MTTLALQRFITTFDTLSKREKAVVLDHVSKSVGQEKATVTQKLLEKLQESEKTRLLSERQAAQMWQKFGS